MSTKELQDTKNVSAEVYQSDELEVSEDEDILNSDDLGDVFFALDRMELNENDAWCFLADWQKRKRTWSEDKELKNALKKDRRHFADPESRAPKDPPAPNRRRKNIAELKRITRCANCGEKGHWQAECQQPYKRKGEKNKTLSAFSYLGTNSSGSSHFGMNFVNGDGEVNKSYVTIPPGHAIIDPGASQDLIGEASLFGWQTRSREVDGARGRCSAITVDRVARTHWRHHRHGAKQDQVQ